LHDKEIINYINEHTCYTYDCPVNSYLTNITGGRSRGTNADLAYLQDGPVYNINHTVNTVLH